MREAGGLDGFPDRCLRKPFENYPAKSMSGEHDARSCFTRIDTDTCRVRGAYAGAGSAADCTDRCRPADGDRDRRKPETTTA
jgi:hypothetical protein